MLVVKLEAMKAEPHFRVPVTSGGAMRAHRGASNKTNFLLFETGATAGTLAGVTGGMSQSRTSWGKKKGSWCM